MKKRLVLVMLAIPLMAVVLLWQIKTVNASPAVFTGRPITSPITSPIISPKPIRTYHLAGSVKYRIAWSRFNFWLRPAWGAIITAVNQKTQETFITRTSWSGNFDFKVKEGDYKVIVSDHQGSSFTPVSRYLHLYQDTRNINFVGKMILALRWSYKW